MNSLVFFLAPGIGVLITVMNTINSRFSLVAGNMISIVVVHLVGLVCVQLCIMLLRSKAPKVKLPLYMYSGGIIGFGTIYFCNIAYSAMPASLAVAFALFGQSVFSLLIDASGFLGRKKYPLTRTMLPGLLLAAFGIMVLAGKNSTGILYAPAALLSGCLPTLGFVVNSQLSEKKGILFSTRMNYLSGLATSVLALLPGIFISIKPDSLILSLPELLKLNPLYLFGGGILGVVMVAMANWVFPRIPALYASLLIFSGQSLTGLLVDSLVQGHFNLRILAGTLVVLSGLTVHLLFQKKNSQTLTDS